MNDQEFERLVSGFITLETSGEAPAFESASAIRPGSWLIEGLGASLTSVGLAYQDAVWAQRYLGRIDTRTAAEMQAWDKRSARAWLRRNPQLVPPEVRSEVARKLEPGVELEDVDWARVADSIEWDAVGPWGPGDAALSDRLRRVKVLYVLTRLVAVEVGPHGAFSFALGSNRTLAGESPLSFTAAYSNRRFEELLLAASRYIENTA